MSLDSADAWKQIPPEEKVALLSRAHATGVFAGMVCIGLGCTLALALHIPFLIWVGVISSPLIFQFAAGKAWRDLRPRLMLEYLAARSASRRFAFSEGAKDLQLNLLFRGRLQIVSLAEDAGKTIDDATRRNAEGAVWVALFRDTVVMMTERPGGAAMVLGLTLDERLKVTSSDQGGYTSAKVIEIVSISKFSTSESRYRLTSDQAGALVVFEKRILQFQREYLELVGKAAKLAEGAVAIEDDAEGQKLFFNQ